MSQTINIPDIKAIKIGPITYPIRIVEHLTDGKDKLDGYISYSNSEIRIDAAMESQRQRAILWHEIVHGILSQAGYDNHQESMVEALSYGILAVLDDNPALRELCG